MPRFHTGLHTSDWHSYPDTPYKAKGWIISFEEQATEFPRGGEYSGDRFYPYKEVIISARDQVIAQRAANTIYNVRNLLQGSNLFGMFSSGPQSVSPVILLESLGTPHEPGESPAFNSSPNIPLASLIAARVSRKLRFVYALARLAISMEIMWCRPLSSTRLTAQTSPSPFFPRPTSG